MLLARLKGNDMEKLVELKHILLRCIPSNKNLDTIAVQRARYIHICNLKKFISICLNLN